MNPAAAPSSITIPEQLSRETAAQTLAAWQALDAEVRSRMHTPGVARMDQIAGLSGMQVFDAMFAGTIPYPPIAQTLNFTVSQVAFGRAEFLGKPVFAHYNPLGSVHGGWIATMLDSAVGCAVHTTLAPNKNYTTLELKVNYTKAVTDRIGMVCAIGQVIHVGGRVATAEGKLVGPDGTLYAHATTTCLIFDPLPAR